MSVSPPKSKSRGFLQEISLNTLNQNHHHHNRLANNIKKKLEIENDPSRYGKKSSSRREVLAVKSEKMMVQLAPSRLLLSDLPIDVQLYTLTFLTPQDILSRVQRLNHCWFSLGSDFRLWRILEQHNTLNLNTRVIRKKCIAERRSKGKLFKGIDRVTGKNVSLRKVLLDVTNAGCDDGVPTSILREISYLSTIDHPNVVHFMSAEVKGTNLQTCYEYGDSNLKECMKFYYQPPLSKFMLEKPDYSMPLVTIKRILLQVLSGLSCIHHHGFIHRNLKPENLLVFGDTTVKLSDFSLSRIISLPHLPYTPEDPKERERSSREARRLWYKAPEVLLRKDLYSFEVDIWATGCLLAELATDKPLFPGESEIEQLFKIFRLMGTPDPQKWDDLLSMKEYRPSFPHWRAVTFCHLLYPRNSPEYKSASRSLLESRQSTLKLLENLGDRLGYDGLDLLQKCLTLNPKERPTASEALKHPFFDDVRGEFKHVNPSPCCDSINPIDSPEFQRLTDLCHANTYILATRKREQEFAPDREYMARQPIITENMRSILVDWLIDVSVHFEVTDETLHLAISYIDRTLSKMTIDKTKLQLVGVTCMKIADVYNEKSREYYRQENANEYAYITADEYSGTQVVEMEKNILNILGFRLQSPTVVHFLKAYVMVMNLDDKVAKLARYLADLMLLAYHSMMFPPSLLASAIIFIAAKTLDHSIPAEAVTKSKQLFDWYTIKQFEDACSHVRVNWIVARSSQSFSRFDAVNGKHENHVPVDLRNAWPPVVQIRDLQEWWYSEVGQSDGNVYS